jgi:tetratricopeptide (TPR) repeat protein
VVVPPPVFVLNPAVLFPTSPDLAALDAPDPPPVKANEKDFIAIRPGQPVPGLAMNLPPPPKPPVVLPPPPPPVPPLDGGEKKPDPGAESARQVTLARAAFGAGQYGRAAERLAVAIRARPGEPRPHFLLAQARFARGEYAEAVAAVRDGMKLSPGWPATAFRPREWYGPDPGRYDAHLAELRAAAAANPDDPTLGFLLGYQVWFTGDRDEAARLFRRVTKQVKDNTIVERFLREVDTKVVGR